MGLAESRRQYLERRYVRDVAWDVIHSAGATDARSRVTALRDYLRATISFQGAPHEHRPFLRASAAETLRSRKGYCGEVTRAFIVLADVVGIRAQRINLWGANPHVVAEAELNPHTRVVVDAQNPPQIAELQRLEDVILRYDDYYTINLRRVGLYPTISRLKVDLGPLTYWTENPHALQAFAWFLLALALTMACLTLKVGRACVRYYLHRRGWRHLSNVEAVRRIADGPGEWPV